VAVGGAAAGHTRAVGVTLGTGVGSAFIDAGRAVTTGAEVPPEGRADLLTIGGAPLEDVVSTRALVAAHGASVVEVLTAAASGDAHARSVVERAYHLLGVALRPWLRRFAATVLVLAASARRGTWSRRRSGAGSGPWTSPSPAARTPRPRPCVARRLWSALGNRYLGRDPPLTSRQQRLSVGSRKALS
jgi:glucokinase